MHDSIACDCLSLCCLVEFKCRLSALVVHINNFVLIMTRKMQSLETKGVFVCLGIASIIPIFVRQ